jgi:hypothetical protein
MSTPVQRLRAAIARRKAAEANVGRVLREQFPAGAFIAFTGHNGNTLLGRVLDHAVMGDRVKVENARTGRAYWVHAWRLQ